MAVDNIVIICGRQRTVEFAVRKDGTSPAKEFFDNLDRSDSAHLLAWFKKLAQDGEANLRFAKKLFKCEKELPKNITIIPGHLWTFKRETRKRPGGGKGMIRIPCFQYQRRWILMHGFWKPARSKWPDIQVSMAFQIIREVVEREQNKHQ